MIPRGQKEFVFEFAPDEKVRVKSEYLNMCGGLKKVEGYISSIEVDRNGVMYKVITSDTLDGSPFRSTKLPGSFLELQPKD